MHTPDAETQLAARGVRRWRYLTRESALAFSARSAGRSVDREEESLDRREDWQKIAHCLEQPGEKQRHFGRVKPGAPSRCAETLSQLHRDRTSRGPHRLNACVSSLCWSPDPLRFPYLSCSSSSSSSSSFSSSRAAFLQGTVCRRAPRCSSWRLLHGATSSALCCHSPSSSASWTPLAPALSSPQRPPGVQSLLAPPSASASPSFASSSSQAPLHRSWPLLDHACRSVPASSAASRGVSPSAGRASRRAASFLCSSRGTHANPLDDDAQLTQKRLSPLRIDYEKAFELLEQADPTGIEAMTAAYNAALHTCERQRDRPGALRLYASMREKQIPIDVVTLHSLFTLLEYYADDTALLQILDQVDALDSHSSSVYPFPSSASFSPVAPSPPPRSPSVSLTPSLLSLAISTCCRATNARAAARLMERLKTLLRRNADKFLLTFASVLPPDTAEATAAVTHPPGALYVQLIIALTQEGRYDDALRYYEELKALQRRFMQKQHLLQREVARRAEHLERTAAQQQMHISDEDKQRILGEFEAQLVQEQEHLLEDYQPPITAVNAALEACLRTGRLKQALVIYKEDVQFAQQQRRLAGEALDQAEPQQDKSSPTRRTFELLLRACSQQRQFFALAQIWRDFERQGGRASTEDEHLFRLPAAAPCYAAAIQGFAACGYWDYALRLLLVLHRETGTLKERYRRSLAQLLGMKDLGSTAGSGRARDDAGHPETSATGADAEGGAKGDPGGKSADGCGRDEAANDAAQGDSLSGELILDLASERGSVAAGVEPYIAVLRACRDSGAWKPALGTLRLLQQRHQKYRLLHALEKARERREDEARQKFEREVVAFRRRLLEAKQKASPAATSAEREAEHAKASSLAPLSALLRSEDPALSQDMERLLGSLDGPMSGGRVPVAPEFPFVAYALTVGACAAAEAWGQVLAVSAEFFSPRNTVGVHAARGSLADIGGPAGESLGQAAGEAGDGPQAPLEIRKTVHAYRLIALMRLGRPQEVEAERRSLIRLLELERRTRERRQERECRRQEYGSESENGLEGEAGGHDKDETRAKWREGEEKVGRESERERESGDDAHGVATRALEEAEAWLVKTAAARATGGESQARFSASLGGQDASATSLFRSQESPGGASLRAASSSLPFARVPSPLPSGESERQVSSRSTLAPMTRSEAARQEGEHESILPAVTAFMPESFTPQRAEPLGRASPAQQEPKIRGQGGAGTGAGPPAGDGLHGAADANQASIGAFAKHKTGGQSLESFFAGLAPASEREAFAAIEDAERSRRERRCSERRQGVTEVVCEDTQEASEEESRVSAATDTPRPTARSEHGHRNAIEYAKERSHAEGDPWAVPLGSVEDAPAGEDVVAVRESAGGYPCPRAEDEKPARERVGDVHAAADAGGHRGRAVAAVAGEEGTPTAVFLSSILGPRRLVLENIREEPVVVDATEQTHEGETKKGEGRRPRERGADGEDAQNVRRGQMAARKEGLVSAAHRGDGHVEATGVQEKIHDLGASQLNPAADSRALQDRRETAYAPQSPAETPSAGETRAKLPVSAQEREEGGRGQADGRRPSPAASFETGLDLLLRHRAVAEAQTNPQGASVRAWLTTRGDAHPAVSPMDGPAAAGARATPTAASVQRLEGHPPGNAEGTLDVPKRRAVSAPPAAPRDAEPLAGSQGHMFMGSHGWGWPPHWEEKLDKARERLWGDDASARVTRQVDTGTVAKEEETESPWGMRPAP
ncbi:hypothetical protein BESB_014680 [Besnoitia besnoiti]|uniref:PPR repeat-containing protein n=1 Tax=Besnoitia besnoiti TaxID=94643 RepID=A0A2A9M4G1_BESBE|nr:hypothetical protein BESB_014680 [Besnoitia besnoiti]PFH32855.1 hypothetical protein BESB_014680 [Besnoitia besnoiti]